RPCGEKRSAARTDFAEADDTDRGIRPVLLARALGEHAGPGDPRLPREPLVPGGSPLREEIESSPGLLEGVAPSMPVEERLREEDVRLGDERIVPDGFAQDA